VALTDPELELLLEALEDAPGDQVYLKVGEELIRRAKWAEAGRVLTAGLDAAPIPEAWLLAGRARLELGDPEGALKAVLSAKGSVPAQGEAARIQMLALERCGRPTEARQIADRLISDYGTDVVAQSLIERLDAPEPEAPPTAPHPTLTPALAERFAEIQRYDRAIRIYRRLFFNNPGHESLKVRLRELSSEHPEAEDLTRDSTTEAPLDLEMAPLEVVPRLGATPLPVQRALVPSGNDIPSLHPATFDDSDEEETDISEDPTSRIGESPRRRRRSLLNP
jgi:tetratricopeptide (TPR) repeat protein